MVVESVYMLAAESAAEVEAALGWRAGMPVQACDHDQAAGLAWLWLR